MKKRWVRLLLLLACGLVATFLASPLRGQAPHTYEPFIPSDAYQQAHLALADGQVSQALQTFQQIADQNPGTTLGAESLFRVAEIYNNTAQHDKALALYQAIIAQYPRSQFEIRARWFTLSLTVDDSEHPQPWVAAMDQLAQSFGGPALSDILRGNRGHELAQRVHVLPLEFQNGLDGVYAELHDQLAFQERRFDEAIQLALFNREAFPRSTLSGNFVDNLQYDLVNKKFGSWTGFTSQPVETPVVTPLAPKPGQNKGPRPKIRFEATDGDFRQPQVDLSNLKLAVDGQDMTPMLTLNFKTDLSLREGAIFERIRASARPTAAFAPGLHTITVTAPRNGYNGSGPGLGTATWTFIVANDQDDSDDERDDNSDDGG